MDIIKSLTFCGTCTEVLEQPITLPCDHSICQKHIDSLKGESSELNCPICDESHSVPEGGFRVNETIKKLIKSDVHKLVQNLSPFHKEALDELKHLESACSDFQNCLNSSEQSVIDYHDKMINEIDLRKEILQKQLNDSTEKLIQEVNEHKQKCLDELGTIKNRESENEKRLEEIIQSNSEELNKLEMNEKLWKETSAELNMINTNIATKIRILNSEIFGFKQMTLKPLSISIGSIEKEIQLMEKRMSVSFDIFKKNIENMNMILQLLNFPTNQPLNLLYRASTDGFSSGSFHSKCDGKSKTLTIIKSENGNIFGGYTNAAWDFSSGYKSDSWSVLFSLINQNGIPVVLTKYHNSAISICCHASYGPTFGLGHDFMISSDSHVNSNSYSNLGHTYTASGIAYQNLLAGSYQFKVQEIEVYQLI